MEIIDTLSPVIGVLALQGAFEEHQACLEAVGCRTVQVRTPDDLQCIDAIVLPGGESTAIGLIGTSTNNNATTTTTTTTTVTTTNNNASTTNNLWTSLQEFSKNKPVWGTCAGMILLAERCIGTSAVIEDGQALIGGMDITVCRNYFGSQVSSFEMPIPPPPPLTSQLQTTTMETEQSEHEQQQQLPFPGVFIRAPAILSAGNNVTILCRVNAIPCRQAAVTLGELDRKITSGEDVVVVSKKFSISDSLERNGQHLRYKQVVTNNEKNNVVDNSTTIASLNDPESIMNKNNNLPVGDDCTNISMEQQQKHNTISLPGAADGTLARNVICAVQKDNILCTAFHPELTTDYRWHKYFVQEIVLKRK